MTALAVACATTGVRAWAPALLILAGYFAGIHRQWLYDFARYLVGDVALDRYTRQLDFEERRRAMAAPFRPRTVPEPPRLRLVHPFYDQDADPKGQP